MLMEDLVSYSKELVVRMKNQGGKDTRISRVLRKVAVKVFLQISKQKCKISFEQLLNSMTVVCLRLCVCVCVYVCVLCACMSMCVCACVCVVVVRMSFSVEWRVVSIQQ